MSDEKYAIGLTDFLSGRHIDAIRAWRKTFSCYDEFGTITESCSLMDAKNCIERLSSNDMLEYTLDTRQLNILRESGFKVIKLTGSSVSRRVTVFLPDTSGSKIVAIKNLRLSSGYLGLKDAKDIIDEIWTYNRPVEMKHVTELIYHKLVASGFTVNGFDVDIFKDNKDLFVI